MSHLMTNGEPCGRKDGHRSHHRSPQSLERRRQYDRQRHAELYAQGEDWWQLHPITKVYYDRARNWGRYIVALRQRLVDGHQTLNLGEAIYREDLARLAEAKAQVPVTTAKWMDRYRQEFDLPSLDAEQLPFQARIAEIRANTAGLLKIEFPLS